MTQPDPFARLAPFIQAYIWKHRWTEIRGVQAAASAAIFDSDDHLLISSPTASGKTEAAFLPILTLLHQNPGRSIGVLYVSPLKALINDQFGRLEGLLADSGIPLGAWHGDVGASHKAATLKRASGVLQITPESLEGLLLRKGNDLGRLFGDLRFVVIDELHAFAQGERGRQVQCLLQRLERVTASPPRRVGLSATLGDKALAAAWLRGQSGQNVQVIEDPGASGRTLRLAVDHHKKSKAPSGEDPYGPLQSTPTLMDALYEGTLGLKSLVFCNSRGGVEETAAALKDLAALKRTPQIYHAHHGSVSNQYRLDAERAMKDEGKPACTVATVTLELGIDLGQVSRVFQVDAPGSVAGLVQRLGRSGRRGQPGEMLLCTLEEDLDGPPHRRLPWTLIQTVAMLQLYLEDRWVEPAGEPQLPFSLLVHQTLMAAAIYGESSPGLLASRVLTLHPFRHVSQDAYKTLLRHLLETGILERSETGGLIPGLRGERLLGDWHFLAVFPEVPEYAVFDKSAHIGTVPHLPEIGRTLSLAGRSWKVTATDEKKKTVHVKREKGRQGSSWSSGTADLHGRVVQAMKDVLTSDQAYAYLRPAARTRLQEARTLARDSGLLHGHTHPLSADTLLLTPWTGSRTQRTLLAVLRLSPDLYAADDTFGLSVRATPEELASEVKSLLHPPEGEPTLKDRLRTWYLQRPPEPPGKYDAHVPPALLADAWLADGLDLPGATAWLETLSNF